MNIRSRGRTTVAIQQELDLIAILPVVIDVVLFQ